MITNGQILHNRAVLSGGFYGLAGGGGVGVITGSLHINGGAVSHNRVEQFGEAAEAQGGGIVAGKWSGALQEITLEGVAITSNQSEGGTFSYGGGVAFVQGLNALITGSTVISGNVLSATQGAVGGGLAVGLSWLAEWLSTSRAYL